MNKTNSPVGVALTRCFYCGEGDRILLNRLLTPHVARKVEAMHNCVIDLEPCKKCAEYMKQGVILITIDTAKSDRDWNTPPSDDQRRAFIPNPYRTGGFMVVKDEAIKRLLADDQSLVDYALKHRWMFIEHEAAEKIGLFEIAKEHQKGNHT